MAAYSDLGARALAKETPGSLAVQPGSPVPGAGGDGDATNERIRSPQKDNSILEQLMDNLMLALAVPHV
jgi:hypothetical protein